MSSTATGSVKRRPAVVELVHALGVLDGVADQALPDLLLASVLGDLAGHVRQGTSVRVALGDGQVQLGLGRL